MRVTKKSWIRLPAITLACINSREVVHIHTHHPPNYLYLAKTYYVL